MLKKNLLIFKLAITIREITNKKKQKEEKFQNKSELKANISISLNMIPTNIIKKKF